MTNTPRSMKRGDHEITSLTLDNDHFSLDRLNGNECKLYHDHNVFEDLTWDQVETLPALIEEHRRIWEQT